MFVVFHKLRPDQPQTSITIWVSTHVHICWGKNTETQFLTHSKTLLTSIYNFHLTKVEDLVFVITFLHFSTSTTSSHYY